MKAVPARMGIALLSLVAGLSAVYLHLYKIGKVGSLTCSTGGCDKVMFSPWGWFLGFDVALIGICGYLLLLGTSLAGLQTHWQTSRPLSLTIAVLAGGGFLFTLRLKYAEFVILHTFCPWCAISAVCITVITAMALGSLPRA